MMLNEHLDDLKPGGILITDPDLVWNRPTRGDILFMQIPLARIADGSGQRLIINMIMLGVLTATTRIVSKDALTKAISATVPTDSKEVNIEAFEVGIKLAEKVRLEGR